ncbi:hypothetical protein C8E97_1380 [Saccharothrix australiensis]|uniref:Uncharacterized protein n=1 Tax=Saccharothrix australiensis TaxID=2072 RepID=A0A495VU35_9PSEU|nr:hypothetical protein C8E97_1380 [Saccharothrix australiensis]
MTDDEVPAAVATGRRVATALLGTALALTVSAVLWLVW